MDIKKEFEERFGNRLWINILPEYISAWLTETQVKINNILDHTIRVEDENKALKDRDALRAEHIHMLTVDMNSAVAMAEKYRLELRNLQTRFNTVASDCTEYQAKIEELKEKIKNQ